MQEKIFNPLGMEHSSFSTAPATGGVILGDPVKAGWLYNLGEDNASGSVYMSTADFATAGMAMLNSAILSPSQTRRWFKPQMQTGFNGNAVGAPWEITNLESPNNRLTQYYTKQGDLNGYHAALVLSPEHEVGWVVLTAGTLDSNAPVIRTTLMNSFAEILMPAVEAQAQVEAGINFNGTFTDPATNSSITVAAGDNGHAGLSILQLTNHGVEIFGTNVSPIVSSFGIKPTTQMFPTTLKTISKTADGTGTYESRLGFRMVYFQQDEAGVLGDPCLNTWTVFGAPTYGQRSLDDIVFNMAEDGTALSVELRMLRLTMTKVKA
jgi:hypothetical protein